MKAAAVLIVLVLMSAVSCDIYDDYGVCLFDENLCKDLHTICVDKPHMTLRKIRECARERTLCIEGLPTECKDLTPTEFTTVLPGRNPFLGFQDEHYSPEHDESEE
ncbi:uncharacterized protein LOC131944936 [Physella acuta]|uniref:uncharacterized protein LOC131944936 n=1 Tax=Physella acuta TaxID=109671 RepID=UPI0027DAE780|nr:uncharacterized protein LOC131944936 [Physella acuta]